MHKPRNQQTLAAPCAVEGFGYWSGHDVRVEFRPAAADSGLVFVRDDLPGRPRIPATIASRVPAQRRTNLCHGGVHVEMVEHVMAALAGLHVDNCEIGVTQAEMPGCDGSCLSFVEAIDSVGIQQQAALRPWRAVDRVIRLGTGDSAQGHSGRPRNEEAGAREHWIEAIPCCSGKTVLQYELDYGPGPIGRQCLQVTLTPAVFRSELAPCRTFALRQEAEALQRQGLARRVTVRDLLVFDEHGPIDNPLRFADECVRHKLLDMVGDLALAGCDLFGRITASRSGHQLNAELVQMLLAEAGSGQIKRCA